MELSIVLPENIPNRVRKLRKIIGDENFEKWRAAHPQELPKMP